MLIFSDNISTRAKSFMRHTGEDSEFRRKVAPIAKYRFSANTLHEVSPAV
jgi:hypothetical protein